MNWFQVAPYISNTSTYSWIDEYLTWAAQDTCCMYHQTSGKACIEQNNLTTGCEECYSLNEKNRPIPSEFFKHLNWFLNSTENEGCSIIGQVSIDIGTITKVLQQFAADVVFNSTTSEVICSR